MTSSGLAACTVGESRTARQASEGIVDIAVNGPEMPSRTTQASASSASIVRLERVDVGGGLAPEALAETRKHQSDREDEGGAGEGDADPPPPPLEITEG